MCRTGHYVLRTCSFSRNSPASQIHSNMSPRSDDPNLCFERLIPQGQLRSLLFLRNTLVNLIDADVSWQDPATRIARTRVLSPKGCLSFSFFLVRGSFAISLAGWTVSVLNMPFIVCLPGCPKKNPETPYPVADKMCQTPFFSPGSNHEPSFSISWNV